MTSRTESTRKILGIRRKLVELRLDTRREGLTFACSRRPWAGVERDGRGADEKARIERLRLSLSLCRRTFKLRVIKSFVPEQRSRKCFSCFEIPMFYVIYMNIVGPFHTYPYRAMVQSVIYLHS